MSDDLEKEIALYEAERNRAWHSWFAARGDVSPSDEHTRIFDGGFRMAWELCRAQPAPQPAPDTALVEAFDAGRRAEQADVAQLVEALEEIAQWVGRWASADHPVATVARKALAAHRKGGDA